MAWEVEMKKMWNLANLESKEANVDRSTQYSTTFENKLAAQVTINLKGKGSVVGLVNRRFESGIASPEY